LGPGNEDVELAGRIALLAGAAGCPMIGRADAALLGDADELAAFSELQSIPEARYIALALPGFLLRLPYGKETSPTELFPLEEMLGDPKHSEYLWGNPALACAALMAEAFSESGWDMRPSDALDILGLPAHVYKKGRRVHHKAVRGGGDDRGGGHRADGPRLDPAALHEGQRPGARGRLPVDRRHAARGPLELRSWEELAPTDQPVAAGGLRALGQPPF